MNPECHLSVLRVTVSGQCGHSTHRCRPMNLALLWQDHRDILPNQTPLSCNQTRDPSSWASHVPLQPDWNTTPPGKSASARRWMLAACSWPCVQCAPYQTPRPRPSHTTFHWMHLTSVTCTSMHNQFQPFHNCDTSDDVPPKKRKCKIKRERKKRSHDDNPKSGTPICFFTWHICTFCTYSV